MEAHNLGSENENSKREEVNATEPSIERFYGALLFVDISGFTPLAQKLDVESLKNHINDYFTKMLNVIDKWEGDVIKFAGDALYIVWEAEYTAKAPFDFGSSVPSMARVSDRSYATAASDDGSVIQSINEKTARNIMHDSRFIASAKAAVEKAVSCALEINACCCNHKVVLEDRENGAQSKWSKLFNSLPIILGNNGSKVAPMNKSDDKNAYLNVHSGVGFGLLAGVDVGCRDRWEYFLLGEPITQVANAESLAATGDVVISSIAHSLIHHFDQTGDVTTPNENEPGEQLMTCGCCRLATNFFRISKFMQGPSPVRKPKYRRSKSKAKFDEFALTEALASNEEKLYEFYGEEIEGSFTAMQNKLKKNLFEYLKQNNVNLKNLLGSEEDIYYPTASHSLMNKIDRYAADFIHHQVRQQFYIWVSKCLIDDLVKHTHDAARAKVEFFNLPRLWGFHKMLDKIFDQFLGVEVTPNVTIPSISTSPVAIQSAQSTPQGKNSSFYGTDLKTVDEDEVLDEEIDATSSVKPFSGGKRRSSLVGLRRTNSQRNMLQDASLSAEMRTVTVMFVKIDGLSSEVTIEDSDPDNSLFQSQSHDHLEPNESAMADKFGSQVNECPAEFPSEPKKCFSPPPQRLRKDTQVGYGNFHFLERSERESSADAELLVRLQKCMEILCTAFASNGGQMRQFIIDDKGTVCIGTFGLRGSMAVDNAAAALETAKKIIIELQSEGLTAAIGITSGKAYCGIVGSPTRHEYAVMGPSVNLSARLMCQAQPCTVICDSETKSRDRAHSFEPLKEVVAKGYVQPVMTYKPIFEDLLAGTGTEKKISEQALSALSPDAKWRPHHGFLRSSLDSVALESFNHFTNVLHRDSFDMDSSMSRKSIMFANPSHNGSHNPIVSAIADSEFYVQRKKGSREFVSIKQMSQQQAIQSKLYGREKEISQIIEFLFLPFSVSSSTLLKAYHNLTFERSGKPMFELTCACRLLAVTGQEGLGKSALVNSIAKKLLNISRQDTTWNLSIFKNRSSSIQSNVPFYPFVFIVQDLLVKVHRHFQQQTVTNNSSRIAAKRLGMTIEQQIRSGLAHVAKLLTPELVDLFPLLSFLSITPAEPDTARTQNLSGRSRYLFALELIFQICQAFPTLTGNLSFVVL